MQILAIVAHPDDADIFCGGTLAKHADRGDDVTIAHLTAGEYGALEGSEDEIASRRKEEAKRAATTLGCDCTFLGFSDGRVESTVDSRLVLVDAIRRFEPDLIVTHHDDDMHPDHRATSTLVTDAYYMASLPLVGTDHDPHDPRNVYFFGKPTSSFTPREFIDISAYQDHKERAIRAHESQLTFLESHGGIDAEFDDLVTRVRARGRVLGAQAGVEFAEGFTKLHEDAATYLC